MLLTTNQPHCKHCNATLEPGKCPVFCNDKCREAHERWVEWRKENWVF